MNNPEILDPLSQVLTVKSAAILRTVSKMCKEYIKVKNYSFYRIFKQLDLSVDSVIKMIFEADSHFIEHDDDETFYYPIQLHDYSESLKQIVLNSKYYYTIMEFADQLIGYDANNHGILLQLACNHCVLYTEYHPLQGLLVEMCMNPDLIE